MEQEAGAAGFNFPSTRLPGVHSFSGVTCLDVVKMQLGWVDVDKASCQGIKLLPL